MYALAQRLRGGLTVLLALATLAATRSASAAQHEGLPNFVVHQAERTATLKAPPGGNAVQAARLAALAGATVRYSGLTGTASRVIAQGDALTAASEATPDAISRRFLATNPQLFGLSETDVAALYTTRQYSTYGLGITHLWLGQQYRGIPVFGSELAFNVDHKGRLVTVSGSVAPRLPQVVNTTVPKLQASQALAQAARHAGLDPNGLGAPLAPPAGARQTVTYARGEGLSREPVVELSFYQTGRNQVSLAWDTTLWQTRRPDVYHILIDASTGELLFRNNYTNYAPQGQVFDKDSPQDGTPYNGVVPNLLQRVMKPFDGRDVFSSNDQHHDWWAGKPQTSTTANNVVAGLDRDGTDIPTPITVPSGNFSFPLDLTGAPSTYPNAAISNLFYWNNVCHDVFYKFGFNEAAGNFQNDNFGLGGKQGDAVSAMAQYGADFPIPIFFNNATFLTPPDGVSGEMSMYEFDLTTPSRDGDFANEVIVHEFGHGLSNRLVGNANGLTVYQSRAMGEGWSDFCALMLVAESTDNVNGKYPIGGYVTDDFANGIRSQPYSTQNTVFSRTYKNIADTRGGNLSVHLGGEIICNALWTMYGRLHARLGFTAARDRAIQLHVDGLKLCPSNPTFLDYRDAVLRADQNRFGGEDVDDIWQAFAAHGMGFSASSTNAASEIVVEAFDTPPLKITGKVTSGGAPLAGVTISTGSRTAVTAGDGTYSLNSVSAGTYTVTPSKQGFAFTPLARTVTVSSATVSGVDFDATQGFTISGRITLNGGGLGGVTVSAGGKSAVTQVDGTYALPELPANNYVVIPSRLGYEFTPASVPVNLASNTSGVDFSAVRVLTITGTVTENGQPLAGVVIGGGGKSGTSGPDGKYVVTGLQPGLVNLTPVKAGYDFNPSIRAITLQNDQVDVDFTATRVFLVTGKVTESGQPLAGVTVTAGADSAVTGADGAYILTRVTAGSHSVTPAKAGYAFAPASLLLNVNSDKTAIDFAATRVFTISGKITDSGNGLVGTTLTVAGQPALIAADGSYTISGVPGGTYSVTPSRPGYAFTPATQSVTLGPDATGVDFAANRVYTVSGRVTQNGSGLAAATVAIADRSATTAGDGSYSIPNLLAGTYEVKPSLGGYRFDPSVQTVTVGAVAEVQNIDFQAVRIYTISGKVLEGAAGLAGATVTAAGQTTTTGQDGSFAFGGLPAGTYDVAISRPGYVFDVGSRSATVGPDATNVNFAAAAIFSIAGTVMENGSPLAGVKVTAGAKSATTGADGTYSFSGLPAGSYAVTATLASYSFDTATRNVAIGPNAVGVDFAGTRSYSISGRVTENNVGLAGVGVSVAGKNATTAADGGYSIAGLPAGTYSVSVARTGYGFAPATQSVTVAPDATGVDFAATRVFTVSGRVTENNVGLEGVTVTAGGKSAATGADGSFVVSDLAPGSYTFSASRAGYRFEPATTAVTVLADVQNVSFQATRLFNISGSVTENGVGLSGVTLTAGALSATTGPDGSYAFKGLPAGTFVISPSRAGYVFGTPARPVTVGPDAAGIDFSATQVFTISGKVTENGTGVAGVTVTAGTQSTATGPDGTFAFSGLAAGTYPVSVSRAGFVFDTPVRNVTVGPDAQGVSFTGSRSFTLSGRVVANGAGVPGVTVSAAGRTAVTDGNGGYAFTGLGAGTYTVSASGAGLTFAPASIPITVGPDASAVDFTATRVFTIAGSVTENGLALPGITVSLNGRTTTSGSDGSYAFSGLAAGTYTVSVSGAGFVFAPSSTAVTVGPDAVATNFTATRLFSLAGTVRENGVGVSGVTVTAGSASTITGADGGYVLPALPAGSYTVGVARTGFTFTPASLAVDLRSNQSAVDFTGSSAPTLADFKLSAASVKGTRTVTATVTLSKNATTNTVVTLAGSNSGAATLPKTVTVRAGSKTATARITTKRVRSTTPVVFSASLAGVKKEAALSITR